MSTVAPFVDEGDIMSYFEMLKLVNSLISGNPACPETEERSERGYKACASLFLKLAAEETEPFEPKTLQQAKNDASWLEWEIAMLDEVNSLNQNKSWELVDPPKDRRILSGKWVYKLKRGPHGEVIRHKSRW